jgi:N-methylhydantoinase A
MVNAIKVVSIERGIDPREYTMVVGGGAGAVHAGMLAAELGMKTAIIPRYAGVFCSYGMVVSDVRHDYMKAFPSSTSDLSLSSINQVYAELESQAVSELMEEGFTRKEITLSRFADAKHPNQIHELTIPIPSTGPLAEADVVKIADTFHQLHERMFTYNISDSPVDLYHWRLAATGRNERSTSNGKPEAQESSALARKLTRNIYFGDRQGHVLTDVYDGSRLAQGMTIDGPAVIEQENTTVAIFSSQRLHVGASGDFTLET